MVTTPHLTQFSGHIILSSKSCVGSLQEKQKSSGKEKERDQNALFSGRRKLLVFSRPMLAVVSQQFPSSYDKESFSIFHSIDFIYLFPHEMVFASEELLATFQKQCSSDSITQRSLRVLDSPVLLILVL